MTSLFLELHVALYKRRIHALSALLIAARLLGIASLSIDISTDRLVQLGRASFQPHFDFPLDDWQCQAGGAISEGSNIILCAPTGAGKVRTRGEVVQAINLLIAVLPLTHSRDCSLLRLS